jgi:hypothetical protein
MARAAVACLLFAGLLSAVAGCAGQAARTLGESPAKTGQAAQIPEEPVPSQRPSVRIRVAPGSHAEFQPVAEQATDDSGLFSTRVSATDTGSSADYTVELSYQVVERPLRDAEQIWSMTTMLLLTMYPSTCNRYQFTLTADVLDREGRLVKSYRLEDVDTAWLWLLMGPRCGSPEGMSGDGVRNAAVGQMRAFYGRASRDGVFDPARAAALMAGARPLVLVRASGAEEQIRQGLLIDDPAARFTFDAAQADEADYVLETDLAFTGGEFSPSRAYLAIMTLGLSGVCSMTYAKLSASLLDRNGELLQHYAFRSMAQATMATNCAPVDQYSRPDLVVGLARKLNVQLRLAVTQARSIALGGSLESRPLVKVRTNCLQPVVEEVTAEVKPFPRVTFQEAGPTPADYELILTFDTRSANAPMEPGNVGQGILRGVAFAWDLHRIVCKPTTVTLQASLDTVDGRVLATYRLDRSEQTRDGFCGTDAPELHPKAVEALTREAYTKIAADGRLAVLTRRGR